MTIERKKLSYVGEHVENHVLSVESQIVVFLNIKMKTFSLLVNWVDMLISAA